MTTIATLLSGGEGVGVGARAAGVRHLWGVEIDDAVAQVARDNGFDVITGDIMEIDPCMLEAPDILHASPECQNASSAKHDPDAATLEEKETRGDVEIAECIVRYLEVLEPRCFTLENVYGYRRFQSFKVIMVALNRLGYFTHFAHLNSADFGVPQTRRRLILRAVRHGLVPMLPLPERPWRGWYQAIEDLIPTLPESEFAPWQRARLPEVVNESWMIRGGNGGPEARGGIRYKGQPATTVMVEDMPRAFIVDGQNAGRASGLSTRDADEPSLTVTSGDKGMPRAFVVDCQKAGNPDGDRSVTVRQADEPIFTVLATMPRRPARAWFSHGRVVKMTPRCLARFQSFPDSYLLPEHNGLAHRVIGNAVPPLMYEKLVRGLNST